MQKNFALFIAVSLGIIMGWLWLQNQLWPPRRPDQQQQAKLDAAKKKEEEDKKADTPKDDFPKDKEKETKPKVEDVKPPVKPPEPKDKVETKVKPEPPPETFTLGSADTHLQVVLTTRGAGVQKLTLNRFKGADYLGKPTEHNLELIQDDAFMPSYLMHHYAEATSESPVLGLGERTWHCEAPPKDIDGVQEVKFVTQVPGRDDIMIVKTYRLGPKDYHVTMLLEIERAKNAPESKESSFRYQLTGAHGLPVEGEWYTSTFRNALIGVVDGRNSLFRDLQDAFHISNKLGGDRVPESSLGAGNRLQYAGVATQYFAAVIAVDDIQPDKALDRKGILAFARPTLESTEVRGRLKFIGDDTISVALKDKLTRLALLPHVKRHLDEIKLKIDDQVMVSSYSTSDGQQVATWIRRGQSPRPYLDDITVRVNSAPFDLPAGAKVAHQYLLYHGPVKVRQLTHFSGEGSVDGALVDRYSETLHLRTLTDYQSPGPFGWFAQKIMLTDLLIATTKLMHGLLFYLNWLCFGVHGLSIVLLTVLVRGLMFPISKKQAMFSIKMQELAPEMKKMQEKYKNDPQGRTQATMELYRKHSVHPLGGCLPIFMQFPIFLGLYYALQESINFRLAGFLWMDNLAAPDMLKWWSEAIPFVSEPDSQGGFFYLGPFFNLLPLFAVGLMFIQQKLMTPPAMDEQQAMQQKTFQFMMIFMGVMFYKVASGLCIYFIASSLWGVAERKLLPKKKTAESIAAAASVNGKATPMRGKTKVPEKPEGNATVQKVKGWWADILKEAKKK